MDILLRFSGSHQYIVEWLYHSQILSHDINNNPASNNNSLNNYGNESIYLLNEIGDYIPSPSPLNGLVFECGEVNLSQYLTNNSRVPIIEKIHILEHIVSAVSFLHKLNIVHFDLKPENIVRFNTTHGTRWKLIDFDSSFDLNITPKPSLIGSVNDTDNIRLTEEYVSPEVMKIFTNSNQITNSNIPVEININMDIWSLGLISVFILKGISLWKLIYPQRDFHVSMLLDFNDDILTRLLNFYQLGEKERSFIEECVKVDPKLRSTCEMLRMKTLFSTGPSTINVNKLNDFQDIKKTINEVRADLNELPSFFNEGHK